MIPQEQLIGLCSEIAALVKLGIPLEPALRTRSIDLPKKLGNRVRELSEKLESGQSLAEALKNDSSFPPVYTAVIESGLESGNLGGTLEMLAQHLRVLRDSQRFIVGAMLYPMFVFSIAWLILTVVWFPLERAFAAFYQDFSFTLPLFDKLVFRHISFEEHFLGMSAVIVAVWLAFFIWQYRSSRSVLLTLQPPRLFFWLRKANRELAQSAFAGIVSLLIRSNVPLPKALHLAFQAIGDKSWGSKTEAEIEEYLSDGKNGSAIQRRSPLSHLVRWLLRISDQTVLLSGLKQYREMSAYRAQRRLERLELYLPLFLMFVLGGFVLALYFITIVFPYGCLLYQAATIHP